MRETFALVELGLGDLLGEDPTRRLPGLRNLIVYGHATTQALKGLCYHPDFDAWYTPIREGMEADPLMKHFWKLRSRILKQGTMGPEVNSRGHIKFKGNTEDLWKHAPPGAIQFFLGDQNGGSGWNIELPDGTIEVYYAALPEGATVTHEFLLENAPTEHQDKSVVGASAQELAALYVRALERIVVDAQQRFS